MEGETPAAGVAASREEALRSRRNLLEFSARKRLRRTIERGYVVKVPPETALVECVGPGITGRPMAGRLLEAGCGNLDHSALARFLHDLAGLPSSP